METRAGRRFKHPGMNAMPANVPSQEHLDLDMCAHQIHLRTESQRTLTASLRVRKTFGEERDIPDSIGGDVYHSSVNILFSNPPGATALTRDKLQCRRVLRRSK